MNSEEIEVPNEFVALLEIQEGVDVGEFWAWLSAAASDRGVKLRCYGAEKSMRRMLTDRANFIAEKTSGVELGE